MRILTVGGEYGQIDLTNCAWSEVAFRQAQMVEWTYLGKPRDGDSGGKSGGKGNSHGMGTEEVSAFVGASRAGDLAMICPALLQRVKSETERDASILKSVRQARVERAARESGKLVDEP